MNTSEDTKNKVRQIVNTLYDRVPFHVLKYYLQKENIPNSRGSVTTRHKLLNFEKPNELSSCLKLEKRIKDVLAYSEKYVFLQKPDNFSKLLSDTASLKPSELGLKHEQLELFKAYPFVVNDIKNEVKPTLVDCVNQDTHLTLIFSSIRQQKIRENIPENQLVQTARDNRYQKIIGVRQLKVQCHDVITFWKEQNIIEIRIDDHKPIRSDMAEEYACKLIEQFNWLLSEAQKRNRLGGDFQSTFKAIESIYSKSDEGRIFSLKHVISDSAKEEREQRHGKKDIRKEAFHKGGNDAVKGQTEKYNLQVEWHTGDDNGYAHRPALWIPGSVRILRGTQNMLKFAHISDCATPKEYVYVLNKLMKHCELIEA